MNRLFLIPILAATVILGSCASKKSLENCQNENKILSANYQNTKDKLADAQSKLAASQARVTSLEQQLEERNRDYAKLQASLDKSLTAGSQTNINISKLVDQINESNKYIRHLVEVKSKSDSLNLVLTNNLTRSLTTDEQKEVKAWCTFPWPTTCSTRAVAMRSTTAQPRPSARSPRSSWTTRTTTCS